MMSPATLNMRNVEKSVNFITILENAVMIVAAIKTNFTTECNFRC
jgi:hypothetical protein